MYKYTRQEVAEKLNISTRSVDRYIKSGKLRSKKDGKVVYVSKHDVEQLLGGENLNQEVIIEHKTVKEKESKKISHKTEENNTASTLGYIYKDLKNEIQKKDEIIQTLAMRVGKSEEIAKNSVSLLEFKKSQYLLEESKEGLNKTLEDIKKEKEFLESELSYEKKTNIILIIFVILLLIIAGVVWFMKI